MSLFTDNNKVTDILNRMKLGEDCHIQHPFPRGYQKSDILIEADSEEFHKAVNSDFNGDEMDSPIILGDMLISATINGDYTKCNELLERENASEFIDNKDGAGYSALDYSVIYGFPKITNVLINAGCKNELRPMEELISIPKQDDGVFFTKEIEEKWQPSSIKELTGDDKPVSKSSNAKATSFADAFKKNFAKSGYSDDRQTKIEIPIQQEITPEMIESSLPKSYNEKHILFLKEFADKDVTKLILDPARIDDSILEHRRRMLPYGITKSNLLNMVTNVLREQEENIKSRVLKQITEKVYETIVFYRDMYMRMIDNNKVFIDDSPIHGKGVFALNKIKRGSIVTFYIPYLLEYVHNEKEKESYLIVPLLSRRMFNESCQGELEILRKGTIKFNDNMLMIGDNDYYSDTRFVGHMVNDPCIFPEDRKISFFEYEDQINLKSNVEVVPFNVDKRFMCLVSNRDIEPGEEILVPYGCNYWDDKVSMSDEV